jgi:hypothetical protein
VFDKNLAIQLQRFHFVRFKLKLFPENLALEHCAKIFKKLKKGVHPIVTFAKKN